MERYGCHWVEESIQLRCQFSKFAYKFNGITVETTVFVCLFLVDISTLISDLYESEKKSYNISSNRDGEKLPNS